MTPNTEIARPRWRVSGLAEALTGYVVISAGAVLIWDHQRMLHAQSDQSDRSVRLTRFWSHDGRRP